MSAIDHVTVCVTTYHRAERLAHALSTAYEAGFRRFSIAAPEPDEDTLTLLAIWQRRGDCLSFDVATTDHDIGCNNAWALAAYRARTKRVILLHDDDSFHPNLGQVYETIIAPALDKRDAGFASWDADIKYDDGTTKPCPYWQGTVPTVTPSSQLQRVLMDGLTHSPVISVLNRTVLIRACKEAAENLITNDSIERPGMLLGTELLVYLRHCQTFKRWLHVPQVLSYYGSHAGSGTVMAQENNEVGRLMKGYDLARRQAMAPAPAPSSRLILVHSAYTPRTEADREKQRIAQESWKFHFDNSDMIELPYVASSLPKIRDILDYACLFALPEDIIVYANADAGLTTHAAELIRAGIDRGRGVTSCGNRVLNPTPGRAYKTLTNCRIPGGTEVVAMTPQWWAAHREKMPDMYIGREAWDTCFNALAEDWADGPGDVIVNPDEWLRSRAHTDNVSWHQEHFSQWQTDRLGEHISTQKHNRDLAREFFQARGDAVMVEKLK